jgi:GNAT superfamily N-acetyltransferase
VIRDYDRTDYAACRALWLDLTDRHRLIYEDPTIGGPDPTWGLDAYLDRDDRVQSWVAEEDGAVVGLTGLLVQADQGEVEPVVVTSRLRSRGIGRQLVQHAIADARDRGLVSLSIRPVARNAEAIALFHTTGFRALGHLDMFMDLASQERELRTGITIHSLEFRY